MGIIADLMVRVGADISSFHQNMGTVNKDVEESSAKSGKMGSSFAGAGLLAAGALTGIVAFGVAAVTHAEKSGQAAYQMSEKFGLAKGEASAWLVVASQLGVDSDMLGSGFKFLSKNVETMNLSMHAHVADARQVVEASAKLKLSQDAYTQTLKAHGPASDKTLASLTSLQLQQDHYNKVISAGTSALGPAAQAFGVLGLNAFDTSGKMKSANELMLESADAFAKMPDGIEKTGLAIKVFGKQGMEMLPVLNLGRKGLEDMMAAGKASGKVMSTEQVDAAHKLFLEHKQLDAAVGGFTNKLGAVLMPALITAIPAVMGLANWFGNTGNVIKALQPWFPLIATGMTIVGGIIAALVIPAFITWTALTWAHVTANIALGASNLLALGPILLIIIGVGLLVGGLILLVSHWKQVVTWVENAYASLLKIPGVGTAVKVVVGLITDEVGFLITAFQTVVGWIQTVIGWLGKIKVPSINLPFGIGGPAGGSPSTVPHSNALGLPYVPYDNYLTYLHRGERVQTASEASAGSGNRGGGMTVLPIAFVTIPPSREQVVVMNEALRRYNLEQH